MSAEARSGTSCSSNVFQAACRYTCRCRGQSSAACAMRCPHRERSASVARTPRSTPSRSVRSAHSTVSSVRSCPSVRIFSIRDRPASERHRSLLPKPAHTNRTGMSPWVCRSLSRSAAAPGRVSWTSSTSSTTRLIGPQPSVPLTPRQPEIMAALWNTGWASVVARVTSPAATPTFAPPRIDFCVVDTTSGEGAAARSVAMLP